MEITLPRFCEANRATRSIKTWQKSRERILGGESLQDASVALRQTSHIYIQQRSGLEHWFHASPPGKGCTLCTMAIVKTCFRLSRSNLNTFLEDRRSKDANICRSMSVASSYKWGKKQNITKCQALDCYRIHLKGRSHLLCSPSSFCLLFFFYFIFFYCAAYPCFFLGAGK